MVYLLSTKYAMDRAIPLRLSLLLEWGILEVEFILVKIWSPTVLLVFFPFLIFGP